jgi:hypothetical protein
VELKSQPRSCQRTLDDRVSAKRLRHCREPPGCRHPGSNSTGGNGLLGISNFPPDCGAACATTAPVNQQVTDPVALFATDNNGTVVSLPAVAASGAQSVTGVLTSGIDTQPDNMSASLDVGGFYPLAHRPAIRLAGRMAFASHAQARRRSRGAGLPHLWGQERLGSGPAFS